ncbi:hypothetical protein [Piscirickettsia litoralis]|uniref:Uncharacterized protein n=1 Tax=Piscirickettsia litoralis TaxID=1891921 RepID=A0ABX2ZYR3_9GAMM|nr:hypothetical protein [Piscirickettsia litoralis]ODN41152.1 hypothetical protein BGC07_17920 [Piscirickettsia litoralis]
MATGFDTGYLKYSSTLTDLQTKLYPAGIDLQKYSDTMAGLHGDIGGKLTDYSNSIIQTTQYDAAANSWIDGDWAGVTKSICDGVNNAMSGAIWDKLEPAMNCLNAIDPDDPNAQEQSQACINSLESALIEIGEEGNKPFDTRTKLTELSNEVISSVGGMLSYIQIGTDFMDSYGCCFSAASQINPDAGELYSSSQDIRSKVDSGAMQSKDIANTVKNSVGQILNVQDRFEELVS